MFGVSCQISGFDRCASIDIIVMDPSKWAALPSNQSHPHASAGGPPIPLLFVIAIDPLHKIHDLAMRKGLLHKIRGRDGMVRTSLHADDAVVFSAPIKRDIDNLASILRGFGDVRASATTSR